MIDWIRRRIGGKAVSPSYLQWLINNVSPHKWGTFASLLEAGSRKVWASWKAVDVIASAVKDTDWDLYRGTGTEPVKAPEIEDLLVRPNRFMRGTELIEVAVFHLKFAGNAYWYLAPGKGRRFDLLPLNPKRVKIAVSKSGEKIGYVQKVDGKDVPFELDEVIHFRKMDPDNDYYGLGDVEAGKELFDEHINRSTWSEKFWENGASPSGLLICEDTITDEEAWEKAKRKWQAQYGGKDNSGKTAWLTGKWKYQQLGLTNADMQGIEQEKLNVEQIFLLHGVPLSVAGIREAANYATAELDDQRFRRYTVKPLVTTIEEGIQDGILTPYFPQYRLRFQVTGLVALGTVVPHVTPLFDRGILTPNEIRQMIGLAPVEGDPLMEQRYISAGLVPIDLAGVPEPDGSTDQAARSLVQRQIQELLHGRKS